MVVCVGEVLVDIFQTEHEKKVCVGGAPFNVFCDIRSLGGDAVFFGSVGNDCYGDTILEFSKQFEGAKIEKLKDLKTTQAVVTLIGGERTFCFHRQATADYVFENIVNKVGDALKNQDVKVLHLGSLMLSKKEGVKTFFDLVDNFKGKAKISFDVNYREVFESEEDAKKLLIRAIDSVDIVKLSQEELTFLTGEKDIKQGVKLLNLDNKITLITCGENGSYYIYKDLFLKVESKKVTPIDTTGAGDGFLSYMLYKIGSFKLTDKKEVLIAMKNANTLGAYVTQKKGAIINAEEVKNICFS